MASEKTPDAAKLKAINAGLKKLFDEYKSKGGATKSSGDACGNERRNLLSAHDDAALAAIAIMGAGGSGAGAPAVVPLFLAWIAKLQKVRQCEQALVQCFSENNDARKADGEKRLKQVNDYLAQVTKEKDRVK